MWICTHAFHLPKRGSQESEYEDAFFPDGVFQRDLSEFRCAVADGASESAFSGKWARLLVRWYCRRRVTLESLQRLWLRFATRFPAPWYLEEKVRRGAHAAFVGLSIRDGQPSEPFGGSWEVEAVGDSCFFHVRGNELLTVVPISKSDEFDNSPHLVSTDTSTSDTSTSATSISDASTPFGLVESRLLVFSGEWRPRDSFYLLTDAFAQWTLAEHEAGRSPWEMFRGLRHADDPGDGDAGHRCFQTVVAELRERGGLHNDDTTLLRVEVA